MTTWVVEPHEPLIARDGRPFVRQPGVLAATLPFPFPSTTAGAARGRAGSDEDGMFDLSQDLSTLKRMQVRGPLLTEMDEQGTWQLLAPAPGDALLFEEGKHLRCRRLEPCKPPAGGQIKPFREDDGNRLLPVGLARYDPAKPAKGQPAFWHWKKFLDWLLDPAQKLDGGLFSRAELGIQSLPREERIHVALVRGWMVALEGALFETRGLEFTSQAGDEAGLEGAGRLALWLDVEDGQKKIRPGLDSLGGERRLVSWRSDHVPAVPKCPAELKAHIAEKRACRLVLLTPASFREGYLPNAGRLEYESAKPALRAALVQRQQVVSGWDMEKTSTLRQASARGVAKPTRRLAPAGSVFFLKFADQARREHIHAWIDHFWMKCIGDDEQACLDGFGLATLGTWSGEPKEMHI